MQFWLMKSEPEVYSIEDLRNEKNQTTMWEGVRNYQARNFLRDQMAIGDEVLFYHSNCKPPAIVGLAKIASNAYPDPTQFDPQSPYFDEKSDRENPRWLVVDVRFKAMLTNPVTLPEIKEDRLLKDMKVAQRGMRLSVQPVDPAHFKRVVELSRHSSE